MGGDERRRRRCSCSLETIRRNNDSEIKDESDDCKLG